MNHTYILGTPPLHTAQDSHNTDLLVCCAPDTRERRFWSKEWNSQAAAVGPQTPGPGKLEGKLGVNLGGDKDGGWSLEG